MTVVHKWVSPVSRASPEVFKAGWGGHISRSVMLGACVKSRALEDGEGS